MGNFIYRFLDENNEIIYIGKTQNMYARMCGHYTPNGGASILPDTSEIKAIQYFSTKTVSDSIVYEAYLIAKYKPKYNKEFKSDDELTIQLDESGIVWNAYTFYRGDNPEHNFRVFKNGELLYEFPKVHELYDPLAKKLGLTAGMEIPFGSHIMDGEYEVCTITTKRRILTGACVIKPRYKYGRDYQFKLKV